MTRSPRRAIPLRAARRGRWRRRTVTAALCLAASVGGTLPAAAASAASSGGPTPAAPADGGVSALETQVATIETQIARQQQVVSSLAERYDEASVRRQQLQARLTGVQVALGRARRRYDTARATLRRDAIDAYIGDAPADSLESFFADTTSADALRQEYQATAAGNVARAIAALDVSKRRLVAARGTLRAQEALASAQAAAMADAERAAQGASNAETAILSGVRGRLALLIAQQAAARAAAEAAAAQAAANQAAKQRAAEQAAQAAQVAQTVGGSSAAVADATAAANQAATSAGSPVVTGSPDPAPGDGAGETALAAGETYLGVPYVWGGASRQGVDCSGLTMLAWAAAGVGLYHSAALQYNQSTPVPLDALAPGDLLFYDLDGTGIDHVVMYVGSGPYGTSTIIQAAHTGTVVSFDPLWYEGLVGAGRP